MAAESSALLDGLIIDILKSLLALPLLWLLNKVRLYIIEARKAGPPPSEHLIHEQDSESQQHHYDCGNDGQPPRERLAALLHELTTLKQQASHLAWGGSERKSADQQINARTLELRNMRFLCCNDVIDDRYQLVKRISFGQLSDVWLAHAVPRGATQPPRPVALKFLRYPHFLSAPCVEAFRRAAAIARNLHLSAPAISDSYESSAPDNGSSLVYQAMNFIEGETLSQHVRRNFDGFKATSQRDAFCKKVMDEVVQLGHTLVRLHDEKFVHRDVEPGNILADAHGHLNLLDFDCIAPAGHRAPAILEVNTFGFAAPEVLQLGQQPDARADVFSLARVIIYVYHGGHFPNAYARSNKELIDSLNCPPALKPVLRRATNIRPDDRHADMKAFLSEVSAALGQDDEASVTSHVVDTFKSDRQWLYQVLRHVTWGTFVLMSVARPVLTYFNATHLSDNPWIAGFHGFLGSIIWANFITTAFLLNRVGIPNETKAGYWNAALLCGLAGLLGGMLCGVLSAGITSFEVLKEVRWIDSAIVGCEQLHNHAFTAKIRCAYETKLLFSFPLTGTLTGIGVGLWLNLKTNQLLRAKVQSVFAIPRKELYRGALLDSIRFVFRPYWSQLLLLIPVLGCVFTPILFAQGAFFDGPEFIRSLGEGVVHYFGALGLVIGYCLGIAPKSPRSKA